MLKLTCLLAIVIDPDDLLNQHASLHLSRTWRDGLIILGVALLLTSLLFVWARFFRKKEHRHGFQHLRSEKPKGAPEAEIASSSGSRDGKTRRKWRRRRRDHRPRNPTLAETGGLPPIRTDDRPPNSPL